MIEQIYFYIAGGVALVFILLIIVLARKPRKKSNIQNHYIQALVRLVDGDEDQALIELRNVVRNDTENIEAYIQIGRILRNKGAAEDAAKIHRDLLVRPLLKDAIRRKILIHLAQDYHDLKHYQKALNVCEQLLDMQKNDQWALAFKLRLLELTNDWQHAFEISLKKIKGSKLKLALYKVEQGMQFIQLGEEHDARLCFHEALKQNGACVPALLGTVKSYVRENRYKDALKALEKFIKSAPEAGCQALELLQNDLYDMNAFGELEKFYHQILKNNRDAFPAFIKLSDLYVEKGEFRKALEQVERLLTIQPDSQPALLRKIKILVKLYDYEKAAGLAVDSLANVKTEQVYVCPLCGYQQKKYFWHCPNCQNLESAQRG